MATPATPSDQVSAHGSVSVLIVEDEHSIVRFMEMEYYYKIDTTITGKNGIPIS